MSRLPHLMMRLRRYWPLGLVVVILGIGGVLLLPNKTPPAKPSAPAVRGVTYTTPTPSEAPVTKATYTSTAGPTEPKYIRLPSIGAEGFIQKMGIDQHGAVAAPNNVNLAGWYVNSLPPGETGLSIIDGHVDGLKGPGIFYKLNKLRIGDTLSIELGNGSIKTFQVKTMTTVDDAQAASALFTRDYSIERQLNLVTCGGSFNRQSHQYTKRVIVVAEGV